MVRPFEAYRLAKLDAVNTAYVARLAKGFSVGKFPDQPEPETVQCRNETDQLRWLGLLLKCQAALAAGKGDEPIDPPIRCSSNRQYVVSWSDAAGRMDVLMGQYAECLKNLWRLKDAVRDCPSREALKDIDLGEGWP